MKPATLQIRGENEIPYIIFRLTVDLDKTLQKLLFTTLLLLITDLKFW